MDSTRSVRQGQIEIGIIEHDGHEFAAYGATVCGRHVTAYLKYKCGHFWLTTWSGTTMLQCRSEIVDRYWNNGLSLMFRLSRGRFIVGYALGDDGMLFRGELVDRCTDDDARRHARKLSDDFAELDDEDEEAFQAELTEV
jgi:hypothetical protein